jgi:hypothetical protein
MAIKIKGSIQCQSRSEYFVKRNASIMVIYTIFCFMNFKIIRMKTIELRLFCILTSFSLPSLPILYSYNHSSNRPCWVIHN